MAPTVAEVNFWRLTILMSITLVNSRPRIGRRFCTIYPFAPRCLGVAAKRDVTSQKFYHKTQDFENIQTLLLDKIWDKKEEMRMYHKHLVLKKETVLEIIKDGIEHTKEDIHEMDKLQNSVWIRY